jgi:hypothetical protein
MQTLAVCARIWGKTIFLNACFFGLGGILTGDIFQVLGAGLLLIGGFVCTLPLLLLMVPLVNISALLPYNLAARIAWLTFYFIIIVVLFCLFFSLLEKKAAIISSYAFELMATTISGLLVAVLTTRKSLKKFYTTP